MPDTAVIMPVYAQIALDIASRIARGMLREGSKIHGRSVMSSEYGVSPETIRRAMRLLADTGIVEIRHNSGVIVLSAEKAGSYIERFGAKQDLRSRQMELNNLMQQHEESSHRIQECIGTIIRMSERVTESNPFVNYEQRVAADSPVIGRTLSELQFWQQTGATVIAIHRGDTLILSPGPYALLQADDRIVYVGDLTCTNAVSSLINGD